ncbi:bifunctional farnesyl-diphosphate farnesyltransferase/squalene synthase [Dimargaris verticillata]|uniref:Bifunctional farnesyl-diphosphate farnesyltransferase/squalene synthase n=1 Tax=Dimargaris verticillata TaxID=2761393 RepID=A0A9W8AV93_9FUNG|nr:bifunctional farnesyl-diphosphate farnesyltransferase/squalene synthase [Dimargaris verticillata]
MAIATITEVFNNYQVFQRNVKIRKGEAVKLILQSSDINTVRGVFIDYLHRLHAKNSSTDPSYTKVNMLVGSALAHIVPHYQAPACATSAPVLLVAALLTVLVALVYQWQGMLV